MDSGDVFLRATTEENLIAKIKSVIAELLTEKLDNPKDDSGLLTRDDICEFLSINKTTLWNYTKDGKLKSYGIGSRVYYKRDEVIEALKPLKQ